MFSRISPFFLCLELCCAKTKAVSPLNIHSLTECFLFGHSLPRDDSSCQRSLGGLTATLTAVARPYVRSSCVFSLLTTLRYLCHLCGRHLYGHLFNWSFWLACPDINVWHIFVWHNKHVCTWSSFMSFHLHPIFMLGSKVWRTSEFSTMNFVFASCPCGGTISEIKCLSRTEAKHLLNQIKLKNSPPRDL